MKANSSNSDISQEIANKADHAEQPKFQVKKLQPLFVDEVSNISIAPNGACRVYFSTWNTNEHNESVRVDAEIIMTISSLKSLANALPSAIEAAEKAMAERESVRNKVGLEPS